MITLDFLRQCSLLLVVAYVMSVLTYLAVTRSHPTPLKDSYTLRQHEIMAASRKARREVYVWSCCAGGFLAALVHVATTQKIG